MASIRDIPEFDAASHQYDETRYPFRQWVLERVKANGYPEVDDLAQIHNHVQEVDQPTLTKALIADTASPDFQEMIQSYVAEYIIPLTGNKPAIQRFPNIRLVRPARPDMVLPYHQGIWFGHGWGEGTVWLPVTPAWDSNTMRIMKLEKSRELTRQIIKERWDKAQMDQVLSELTYPCNLNPGSAIWFTEGNIHGNVENTTGVTRVSIDFRVLEPGGQFHRKLPAGYFRIPGENKISCFANGQVGEFENVISYSECQTAITRGIPIPLQRLKIKEFCAEKNLKFRYEHIELEGLLHCPILKGLLTEDPPDAILMFSIYSLPEKPEYRKVLLDSALENNVAIIFCNELMMMENEEHRETLELILQFSSDFTSPVVTTEDIQ